MSDEYVTEIRRRLKHFAARAVAAVRTAAATASGAAEPPEESTDPSAAPAAAAGASASVEPGDPDARDETIARLEHALEAERARSAELESAVKALEFKLDVLERSYAKQLADARTAGDATRRELSEMSTRLAETKHELREVTAVRDRLRDMYAFDGRRVPPELRERRPGDEDTIARLLASPVPEAQAESARDAQGSFDEPDSGELLSPELVFDPGEDRDDEDDEHCTPR